MTVKAGIEKGKVQATKLRYLAQGFNVKLNKPVMREEAEYDSCYYEVKVDNAILDKWIPTKINVKITEKSAPLNAFIYAGDGRK